MFALVSPQSSSNSTVQFRVARCNFRAVFTVFVCKAVMKPLLIGNLVLLLVLLLLLLPLRPLDLTGFAYVAGDQI